MGLDVLKLMDQGLASSPRDECPNDVGINDVGEFVALLREPQDVLTKSLFGVLLVVLEVLRIARPHVGALKVADKDTLGVGP